MRVTAFIGAGACIDIDGPSTACITKKVRSVQQEIFVPPLKQTITKPFIEAVALHLETFWRDEPNFEDIFHAIEMLDSCRVGWDITAAKQFRPALSAFVGTTDKSYFNVDMLIVAKKDLISTVAKQVAAHDSAFNPNSSKHYWYSAFWRQATKRPPWDIVTTNYDMCIEKSLDGHIEYEDGFENLEDGVYSFRPRNILNSNKTKIMHLHGSIYYGYPKFTDPNRYIYEYDHEDLYKFNSYANAQKTWFNMSHRNSQAGEKTIAGPIITGLRKTDKLLPYPYNTYNACFAKSLMENSRLLIAGYSFGDLHFNSWLGKMANIHGNNRRIIVISYLDDPNRWHPVPSVMGWSTPMYEFMAKVFKDNRPFKSYVFENPVISADGNVQLYLRGLRDALENHGEEIIDFLSS